MMNVYIRESLKEMKTAFECVKDYKKDDNPLRLLTAGGHRDRAYRCLFTAKEWISDEEWEIWKEIYWDFYWDLSDLVLE